mgnify:FL=1
MEHLLRTSRLDLSGILSSSMAVIKTGFSRLIPLALLSAIPQAIILLLTQADAFSQSSYDSLAPLCALCGFELIFIVLITITYIAGAYTVEAIVQDRPDGLSTAFRYALSRLPQVLLVSIIYGVIVMVGMLLLIIPGIIVAFYLTFAYPAVALRQVSLQALQYSYQLVKGQWWRVFGILLGIGLLNLIIVGPLTWLGGLLTSSSFNIGAILINYLASTIAFFFGVPAIVFFLNEDYLAHPVQPETLPA